MGVSFKLSQELKETSLLSPTFYVTVYNNIHLCFRIFKSLHLSKIKKQAMNFAT